MVNGTEDGVVEGVGLVLDAGISNRVYFYLNAIICVIVHCG